MVLTAETWFNFRHRQDLSLSRPRRVQPCSASHPIRLLALYLEVKRLGRETDDLPPSTAEVKNCEGHTHNLRTRFHCVRKDNCTLKWRCGVNKAPWGILNDDKIKLIWKKLYYYYYYWCDFRSSTFSASCKNVLLLDTFQPLTWRTKMSTPFVNLLLR